MSVHHHREFIVRSRKPVRAAFRAQDFDHVLQVFRHRCLFIRLCLPEATSKMLEKA